ncbi:hypothetical protein KAW48_01710 [candidate division WOR-3 bacterium]|nr:hypothetical protein [candidate division WOR-3 bacterium]
MMINEVTPGSVIWYPPKILDSIAVNTVIATINNEFFRRGVLQYAPTNLISPLCPLKYPKLKGRVGLFRPLCPQWLKKGGVGSSSVKNHIEKKRISVQ